MDNEKVIEFPEMPRSRTYTRDWRRWAVVVAGMTLMIWSSMGCYVWIMSKLSESDPWLRFSFGVLIPVVFGRTFGIPIKRFSRCSPAERAARDAEWNAWKERVEQAIDRHSAKPQEGSASDG